MPRKTPVRELQADEENQSASPLRRSSRLASPGPSKLLQRRNSASEDSPAKLPKAKRLSLSMRRESNDTIPKTEEKLEENTLDTPKRSTRVTRSSSKSPSSLLGETESKPSSTRTRSRTGSISKIEEEINSENEEDLKPKSSQNENLKVKTRRPIKDKIVSLEVIEESPKTEARSKVTLTKKESLISIVEDKDDSKEATDISSQVKKTSMEVEKRKTAVEKKIAEEIDTNSPIQSSNSKVTLQDITTDGTKESPSDERAVQKKIETDSCKISPVVILNSIEKQMNYSEEKISSKKAEISPIKDETKPRNKSPVVVLQSIEKIISKQNHEKYVEFVELDRKTEANMNINKDIMSVKEKLQTDKENSIDQPLDQVLPDELCKSDDDKSMSVISDVVKNVQSINIEEGKIGNKEDIISVKDNMNEEQKVLSDKLCKMNESENDLVKLQKVSQLEKEDEIREAITINDNQCSETLTVTKENTKGSLDSLLVNQRSIIEGSDGSFSISLPVIQNNTQKDITNQINIIDSTENRSECVNNVSNSSENSDKENSYKDKPQISGTEFNEANISESEAIDSKPNILVTKENILASNILKNVNEETEHSFYEPMEIEYTDFNCTVNSSVVESKVEENSSACVISVNKNKEESTNTINKQNELKVEDTNVMDQNKLQVESTVSKEINIVTENVKEVLNESKSNLAENENQDVIRESEICDKPLEESINKSKVDSLEIEQSVSEQTKEIISIDAQKTMSFAFNLDDEQFLSDEDVMNKIQEEKNDNEKGSLDISKLEVDVIYVNSRDPNNDVQLQNENPEINTAKSPSPVFSVDEKQCLSDDENEKNDKIKEQNIKKLEKNDGINIENFNEENIETEKPRSPSPTFSVDDSQNDDKFNKKGNIEETEEKETITEELDKMSQTTKANDKETLNMDDQIKNDFELKETKAFTSNLMANVIEQQSSSDLKIICDQEENVEVVKPAKSVDDKKLIDMDVENWKSKNKKLSKKRRKSNIEDNLTSTVRALIENVDDLDAKVDALIEKEKESNNLNKDESDDEISHNSFIDDMAEEGEEDTPSEGSNDILVEGESLDSVDTTSGSDGSYEQGSFIDDEEVNSLLSGEEDFLEERKPNRKGQIKKINKRRIISDSESNEDQSQVKLSEDKESLQLKIASCDSDDKMSTDPYLGLTPPSHVSVQESSSDIDIRSFKNENEIIINDDDNLKSLEAMKDITNSSFKQIDIVKASSIICLDSDEDVFQQMSESPKKPTDISKAEKLQNEEEASNVASADLTKSPKSRSSLNIQECIKLEDVEDGTLTNKICGIVDFFYSNIKQNNSAFGTVSLNVSLDFADTCEEKEEATTKNLNIENIKTKSLKKRLSESVESLPEKETSKRMKHTLSPQISVSNEDVTVRTPAPAKKIKRKKRDVSEFDVDSVDISDTSPTVTSETIKQRKLIQHSEKSSKKEDTDDVINISKMDGSPTIKAKHLVAEENLTVERKKNKIEKKKSKKTVKYSHLEDTDKENEVVIPQKTTDGKRHKHKKTQEQVGNKESTEYIEDDEITTGKETKGTFFETNEHDIPQKQDKKKKKKLKHLLKIDDEDSKIPKKKKSKFVKSNQQEIKIEIAPTSENIALDEINYKMQEKKKLKLARPDEIKTEEGTDIDVNKSTKQKKKKKSKTVDKKEINRIVEDETVNINQTKLTAKIKSATSEFVELTSNEESKKSKRKRKHDDNNEDNLNNELNTMASSEAPSKSEDETYKKSKKRHSKESFLHNFTKTETPISYFPSHMEELSTKAATSNEEVSKIKKINEKRLKKKKNSPTFSVSTTFDSNFWISTPLEMTIVPSKQNTLQSDAGTSKSVKKRKLQEENETFASKDFKNKMLYDTSRVKRMSTKDLLKNKMKKELLNH